jgi:NADH-quinone oxidoreductase subunit D
MGPQHPALKEPSHFEFAVSGETVVDAQVRLGYVHRGIEKATEQRNWTQNLYLLERICGICSHSHAMAYCMGVEKLADVTVPPRARAIRTVVAEMERIHSHLLWLGVTAHEAGFDTLFMYSWRDREIIMRLLEQLTGNRVNYSANILGGVKFDISEPLAEELRKGIDVLDERTRHYLEVVSSDAAFLQRTHSVGILSGEQAAALGVTGPVARASGVERDLRVDTSYGSYPDFPIKMVVETTGDLAARVSVRLKELLETYRVLRLLLDHLPEGELQTRMPRKVKEGETISRIEAPRGELLYFIKSNGTDTPERVKVRTPTLPNLTSVVTLAVGQHIADIPMILAGVDPCFSCNDRAVAINDGSWTWEQLRQFGIDYYRQKATR